MTTPIVELGPQERSDEVETTEPDFWLEDFDLFDADESDGGAEPTFGEPKTDPSRSVDPFANTLPDHTRYRPNRSRDEALASFLETVRRVFGRAPE